MKIKQKKLFAALFLTFSVFATSSLAQNGSDPAGFFVEGAVLTVIEKATIVRDGRIFADYPSGSCSNCDNYLTYDDSTKIYSGIKSKKLRYTDIADVQSADASIFVDSNNKVIIIQFFN